MADEVSINQLRDPASDSDCYLLDGKSLKLIYALLRRLWAGKNIHVDGFQSDSSEDGGISLSLRPKTPGAAGDFPFKVYTRPKPDAPGEFQARVSYFSSLSKTRTLNDSQEITGLSYKPSDLDSPDDDNWFDLLSDDLIWLEGGIDSQFNSTSAAVKSYGLGSSPTWTPSAPPGSADGFFTYSVDYDDSGNAIYTQLTFRIQIAQTYGDDAGNPVLVQMLNQNLLLIRDIYIGPTEESPSDNAYVPLAVAIMHPAPWYDPSA